MAPFSLTFLLGVLIALTPLGTDTCVPALPAIAADLGAPASAAQLTLTAFFAGVALGQLGWGPLSDRYGRRPMLLAGLGLGLAASLAANGRSHSMHAVFARAYAMLCCATWMSATP